MKLMVRAEGSTALKEVPDAAWLHVVDPDDSTQDPLGSSYRIQVRDILNRVEGVGTNRVVFVDSEKGNDTTGTIERFNLPFQTIAAANTAINTAFTGVDAPSATNPVTVYSEQSGTITENLTPLDFVNYYFPNASLTGDIADSGADINSIITIGNTYTIVSDEGFNISGAASNIVIRANKITSSSPVQQPFTVSNGNVTVYAEEMLSDDSTIFVTGGNVTIKSGKVSGSTAIQCDGGVVDIVGGKYLSFIQVTGGLLRFAAHINCTGNTCFSLTTNNGQTLILSGATVITDQTESITAVDPIDVISYASYSNKAVDANVTIIGDYTVNAAFV